MVPNPNGPREGSCDRAIRIVRFCSGFVQWILLEISWIGWLVFKMGIRDGWKTKRSLYSVNDIVRYGSDYVMVCL